MTGQLTRASGNPVDELVERMGPASYDAVDALAVAAALESDGITDRTAQAMYGYSDVFQLADEVYRRGTARRPASAAPPPPSQAGTARRERRLAAVRDWMHGPLYLLPSFAFPAVLRMLEHRSIALGLVLAGGLGWIWAGGATWLAHWLVSRGQPRSAARLLCWSTVAGLPVAAALSATVMFATRTGAGPVAMTVAVMAYQMASGIFIFYRKELWLALTMVPAVGLGVAYLFVGEPLLIWSVAAGAASVGLSLAVALFYALARSRRAPRRPSVRPARAGYLRAVGPVLLYTALTAGFVLHVQAPYLLKRFDIVLAIGPLLLGMGAVEWRAHRFADHARGLLTRMATPRQLAVRLRWLMVAETLVCMAIVGLPATALLLALRHLHLLSLATIAMTGAYVTLAGCYFLSFILAGRGKFGWLSAAFATATVGHLVVVLWPGRALSPLEDTAAVLGSTVVLQVLLLTALFGVVGQVRHYR